MAANERSKIYRKGRVHVDVTKMPVKMATLKDLWGKLKTIFEILELISDFDMTKILAPNNNSKARLTELAKRGAAGEEIKDDEITKLMINLRDGIVGFYEKFEIHMAGAVERFSGELENLRKDDQEIVDRYADKLAELLGDFRKKHDSPKEYSCRDLAMAYNAIDILLDEIDAEIVEASRQHRMMEIKGESEDLLKVLEAA